jgi:pectinesterase
MLRAFAPRDLSLAALLFLPPAALLAQNSAPKDPDVNVDVRPDVKTGIESTTQYPTIQMAMDHAPDAGSGRVFVHIYPGVYHERVIVTQNRPRMTLIGMGSTPSDVVITNSLNAKTAGGTFFTETVEINGPQFEADNLTIENTAGNTGQAVAAVVRSDQSIFKHVRFLGHQDTLFADFGRQYYTACYITGGVDFIFGNATAVFDHSELHALAPGFLTAQSRIKPSETTGYVIANSRVTSSIGDAEDLASRHPNSGSNPMPGSKSAESAKGTFGLGRPWRPYSRVVYLNTELPAGLNPAGWNNWGKTTNESTAYYAEFHSTGPGANPAARVPWSHQLTPAEARPFEPRNFLRGKDNWDPEAKAAQLP